MDLAQHTDQPTYVEVAGRRFGFSEISLELGGRLQAWIKANYPHPLTAVKGQLDGFAAGDRAVLLDQARREALHWPPAYGTGDFYRLVGETPAGQIETLLAGLLVHQPDATRADAEWLWRKVRRDEAKSALIFGLIFGTHDEGGAAADAAASDPKGSSATGNGMTSRVSIA